MGDTSTKSAPRLTEDSSDWCASRPTGDEVPVTRAMGPVPTEEISDIHASSFPRPGRHHPSHAPPQADLGRDPRVVRCSGTPELLPVRARYRRGGVDPCTIYRRVRTC